MLKLSGLIPRGEEIDRNFNESRPVGEITMLGTTTVPRGWLLCDGTAVSRTLYKALFDTIGTTYGTGDGSTTFNVPDFECASATTMRVPAGAGTGYAIGAVNTGALSNAATAQGGTLAVIFIIRF